MKILPIVLVALVGAASAQPKPDNQEAAALYDEGKRHFDIAEYAAAITAWKAAYLRSSEPLLLFNIAQAHRLAGDCAQANRFYLNYQRVQPKPANQAELDSAMAKCAGIEPAMGEKTEKAESVATPPPKLEAPKNEPLRTEPQPTLPVDRGEDDPGRMWRITGIAVAGTGAVAGVLGVVFAFRASSKADDVSGQTPNTSWSESLDNTEREGKAAQTTARIFGAIGIAALVGGGALWFYGRRQSSVNVDVAITPNQSNVSLSCAF